MKLIFAILAAESADAVRDALVAQQYAFTEVISSGGFLRRGSSTLVLGVREERIESAMETIRAACRRDTDTSKGHQATIFVVDATDFVQM